MPLTGSGTEASLQKITRDAVARFHATWFRPASATLVIVGDTTLAQIQPKLEKLFSAWAKGEAPKKTIGAAKAPASAAVYIVDRPGALQSVIFAGQLAPPKANPREIAIEGMNNVLGNQFSSRINMNLREDKHWAYGAYSFFYDARGERPFVTYAPVQTDKTKESLFEIAKELRGIRGEKPATDDELKFAKQTATLTLAGQWETGRAVADSLGQIVTYGLDERYFETYAGKVGALTLKDLADAAQLVQPERLVWVVVGDRAKIEAGVRELNLGPLRFLDADGNVLAER
jgi:zinc protease